MLLSAPSQPHWCTVMGCATRCWPADMAPTPRRVISSLRAMRAVVRVGCVVLIGACSAPSPSPSYHRLYALGVAAGECPPDIAFYHAAPPGARTRLGVVATPIQAITYTVRSDDPAYNGVSETVTVPEHANGYTFTLDVPMSAIIAITVTANGSHGELPSTCTAVPL